jgi:MFS family permease
MLFYLLPLLADFYMAIINFTTPVWAASENYSVQFICMFGIVTMVCYVAMNLVLARIASAQSARKMLYVGLGGMTGVALAAALVPSPGWMFPLLAALGILTSFFFAPFQMVMHSSRPRPVGESVAFYNVAWSTGYAVGPLVAGLIMWLPSREGSYAAGAAASMTAMALLYIALRQKSGESAEHAGDVPDPQVNSHGRTFYLFVGLASILIQGYAFNTLFFVLPKLSIARGFSAFQLGAADFAASAVQIGVTLLVLRSRKWLYRPEITVFAAALGAGAFVLAAMGTSYVALFIACMMLGSAGGVNYFTSVFYANNDARRSRAVSLNEATVGFGAIMGPVMGALLGGFGETLSLAPYWVAAGLFGVLAIGTFVLHVALSISSRVPDESAEVAAKGD